MTRTTLTRIAVLAAIIGAVAAFRLLPMGEWLLQIEFWARENPLRGMSSYVLLAVLSMVALVPGWIPMMLGGFVFGLVPGLIGAMLATTIGATAAMLAGRTLARPWVERQIANDPRMLALDAALREQTFAIVLLTRLAFVIPFNLLNYAYGATRVGVLVYAVATALGMLPIVAGYVYLGTLARNMNEILSGVANAGPGAWWIVAVAAIAVAAIATVVLVVKRSVGRALDARMRESGGT